MTGVEYETIEECVEVWPPMFADKNFTFSAGDVIDGKRHCSTTAPQVSHRCIITQTRTHISGVVSVPDSIRGPIEEKIEALVKEMKLDVYDIEFPTPPSFPGQDLIERISFLGTKKSLSGLIVEPKFPHLYNVTCDVAPKLIQTFICGTNAINLGNAVNFVILAKSGVSTVSESIISGDVGVSPIAKTAMTGFSFKFDASEEFSHIGSR
jgi:hypothetical protein